MEIRLQKFLADQGVASRRASEKLIEQGRVKVNGIIITEQGTKVNPETDLVELDGELQNQKIVFKYYMLNKPTRVVTTVSDEEGRDTVMDFFDDVEERIFPVGRLDFMSSGLLLLTNDGDLTYHLTHPKHIIDKKYLVKVDPDVTEEQLDILRLGVELELYNTSPCEIRITGKDQEGQSLEMVIHEGKNRQIRRMIEYIGSKAVKLKRIAIGDLHLGKLETGKYRELTNEEVEYLKSL